MKALPTLVVDVVAILVFAILGRNNHDEANTLLGVLTTAWPFLAGAVFGHAICRMVAPERTDPARWRTGLVVWASSLALGMLLRLASGDTVAWSFIIVASVVLAAFLLGWRAIHGLIRRARSRVDATT